MPDLQTRLIGQLIFITDRDGFETPMLLGQTWSLRFSADRRVADASALAPMQIGPFEVKVGPLTLQDTLTVRPKRGPGAPPGNGIGSFVGDEGRLEIPLLLTFKHSLAFAAPSELELQLSTSGMATLGLPDRHGVRLAPAGSNPLSLRMVADGVFVGGELDGRSCSLAIEGELADSPY